MLRRVKGTERRIILALCSALAASSGAAAQPASARAKAAPATVELANEKLSFTIGLNGGRFLKLALRGAEPLSPFAPMGHFLALDGFGAPSKEEQAAGLPFHGEASKTTAELISINSSGAVRSAVLRSRLPLAQEILTRTVEIASGENVVYVTSELESELAVDRPVCWAEHATLGPPFLEPGKLVVDMPATRCRVRAEKAGSTGKLAYLQDFTWPLAPLTKGGFISLLHVPEGETSLDLASCLMDPALTYGWITALRGDQRLLFGYVFARQDYPWVMSWMNYSGDERAARGIEFSTQPFDVSRREAVDEHEMFGERTYKWLPAKSKLRTRFLLFYTQVPDDFGDVAKVSFTNRQVIIQDKAGRSVVLAARLGL